jgi:hypothetical protein
MRVLSEEWQVGGIINNALASPHLVQGAVFFLFSFVSRPWLTLHLRFLEAKDNFSTVFVTINNFLSDYCCTIML